MAGQTNAAPAIIKRKKRVVAGRHHGGAWKIAYADFVTAMMAFFMLMWLLSATTEDQRKGIADYFNPAVHITNAASGGDSVLAGTSVFKDKTLAQTGIGQISGFAETSDGADTQAAVDQTAQYARVQSALQGKGGESQTMERLLSHVVSQVTDEGLVIDVFDTADSPLFAADTAKPTPTLVALCALLTDVAAMATNTIAVAGHVRSYPVVLVNNPVWDLSAARAQTMRLLLQKAGLDQGRITRISGYADRKPATANPMAVRNNRIEVILLRRDR